MPADEHNLFYDRDSLGTEIYDAWAELLIAGSPVEGDAEFYVEQARRSAGPFDLSFVTWPSWRDLRSTPNTATSAGEARPTAANRSGSSVQPDRRRSGPYRAVAARASDGLLRG
jgi:hypothetical protein